MPATRGGVWYDLRETPISFDWRGMTFYFSSETHRNKFVRELRKRETWLNDSLSRRFRCTVMLDELADIQLYTQVETRGFLIVTDDGCEYTRACDMLITADRRTLGILGNSMRDIHHG